MNKSDTIAAIILGAAVGVALLKFFSMSKEEKDAFLSHLKNTTNDLLDDAENTVEKVEQYVVQFKGKGEKHLVDKLYVVRNMLKDFYGSGQRYLL